MQITCIRYNWHPIQCLRIYRISHCILFSVDGVWSAWAPWGTCSVSCGGGTHDRSRSCTNPAPQYGGAQCSGSSSATQQCNTHVCISMYTYLSLMCLLYKVTGFLFLPPRFTKDDEIKKHSSKEMR